MKKKDKEQPKGQKQVLPGATQRVVFIGDVFSEDELSAGIPPGQWTIQRPKNIGDLRGVLDISEANSILINQYRDRGRIRIMDSAGLLQIIGVDPPQF